MHKLYIFDQILNYEMNGTNKQNEIHFIIIMNNESEFNSIHICIFLLFLRKHFLGTERILKCILP